MNPSSEVRKEIRKKGKSVSAARKIDSQLNQSIDAVFTSSEEVIQTLMEDLSTNEVGLAHFLNTTDRSLRTWKKSSLTELKSNKKSKRLMYLAEFVQIAKRFNISGILVVHLINSMIDPRVSNSATVKEFISLPEHPMFEELSVLIIERFIRNIHSIKSAEIRLGDKDFELFEESLRMAPAPNEALKRAVGRRRR